jgi:hypothetical protein
LFREATGLTPALLWPQSQASGQSVALVPFQFACVNFEQNSLLGSAVKGTQQRQNVFVGRETENAIKRLSWFSFDTFCGVRKKFCHTDGTISFL